MSDVAGRPLDHATARIVAELAAALLPSLKSDVRETVAAEIAKGLSTAAAALPAPRSLGAEEPLASLRRFQEAIGRVGSEMTASFAAADASVERSVSDLASSMERFRECMEGFRECMEGVAARLAQTADELARQSSGQFAALSSALASVKTGLDDETLEEMTGLLRFLKEAIPAWEGALKADGRMQTRELSEFSAEMSELAKDMKLNLVSIARESAEKGAARDEERRRLLEESGRAAARRLEKLEKIVILTGAVSAFFWVTLLVVLFMQQGGG
ncbi:MAG: hypothetical protein LBO82_05175 [Synergistaceae bacterium]|jgi:hypothetical protein|nr:hypothetical protein [Synergistaceae bacterium]